MTSYWWECHGMGYEPVRNTNPGMENDLWYLYGPIVCLRTDFGIFGITNWCCPVPLPYKCNFDGVRVSPP